MVVGTLSKTTFSTGHHYQNTDEGDRKVYVSWNKFVTKSFLDAHFERFGGLEYIYMAQGGHFYGFVADCPAVSFRFVYLHSRRWEPSIS